MKVSALPASGNSRKFNVRTKRGSFTIALSYTVRTRMWNLSDENAELSAATELAEAIVSRHDPALPYKALYIFADHTSQPTVHQSVQMIRKYGIEGTML